MTVLIPVAGHTIEAELEGWRAGDLWIHELRPAAGDRIVSWDLVAVLAAGRNRGTGHHNRGRP